MNQIHPGARVAKVTLITADLARLSAFYVNVLGLTAVARSRDRAVLGTDGHGFLELIEHANAKPHHTSTGLYHFALLVPTRDDLATFLSHLTQSSYPLQGAADHLVSEALYLADPDGNGIEVYRDRPREEWPRVEEHVQMDTLPLDLRELLARSGSDDFDGLAHETTVGHIHLRVRDVMESESFYRDTLGFQLTWQIGNTAAFFGAGGYHHHIGVNTWTTRGASPPPPGSTGLQSYTITLPTKSDLKPVIDRLSAAGHAVDDRKDGYLLSDPSGIKMVIATP
jgi:catechol 2,3-dioxygenase